jgi:hypothetical protein
MKCVLGPVVLHRPYQLCKLALLHVFCIVTQILDFVAAVFFCLSLHFVNCTSSDTFYRRITSVLSLFAFPVLNSVLYCRSHVLH